MGYNNYRYLVLKDIDYGKKGRKIYVHILYTHMASAIFKTIYSDLIKPNERYLLAFFMLVIFSMAGYYGYLWYAKPTVENLGVQDMANENSRVSEAQLYFFSADWCPHCKKAKPEWEAFSSEFDKKKIGNSVIQCISVDCTEGEDPRIQEFSIDGYPTIILKKEGKRIDYDAKITKDNLTKFVEQFLG